MDAPYELEDVLGSRSISLNALTIGQLLAAHRLPETMFQPYLVKAGTATPVPLTLSLDKIPGDVEKLLIRAIRNTLFPSILPIRTDSAFESVDYGVGFRQIRPKSESVAEELSVVVDRHQARRLVIDRVRDFADEFDIAHGGCVFGLSGGGDSNALAYGLAETVGVGQLSAFTLVFGEVFSEAAASRAAVLCQELGIVHRVFRAPDIIELLEIKTSLDELYRDFRAAFTHEALHFFGTFLILRTARKLADECAYSNLAFGYNREDLLAEALFMLMNGHRPLPFPVRQIGEHRIVMPVWQVPKLLLDACHPDFSLENYRERDPHTTRQRSLAFFLAHAMDSAYPSFGLSLLTGISKAFDGYWERLIYRDDLDAFVTAQADDKAIQLARSVLSRHF